MSVSDSEGDSHFWAVFGNVCGIGRNNEIVSWFTMETEFQLTIPDFAKWAQRYLFSLPPRRC